jgi:hypothetical protein
MVRHSADLLEARPGRSVAQMVDSRRRTEADRAAALLDLLIASSGLDRCATERGASPRKPQRYSRPARHPETDRSYYSRRLLLETPTTTAQEVCSERGEDRSRARKVTGNSLESLSKSHSILECSLIS